MKHTFEHMLYKKNGWSNSRIVALIDFAFVIIYRYISSSCLAIRHCLVKFDASDPLAPGPPQSNRGVSAHELLRLGIKDQHVLFVVRSSIHRVD